MNKEEIIEMARQAGFERLGRTAEDWVCHFEDIEEFTKLVADKEREACAKLCEEYAIGLERNYSEIIADKIRARGEQE